MLDAGARRLVEERSCGEAGQIEGAADLVMRAGCKQMREQRAASGNGLEAAGSPTAIEKNALRRRRPDDRRRVGDDIDDPTPLPHQLELAEGWNHFEQAGDDEFLHRRRAALRMGSNAVETAAEDDLALVRLARVDAGSQMQNNDVEARLDWLADHRLQRVRVDRQLDSGLGHELR